MKVNSHRQKIEKAIGKKEEENFVPVGDSKSLDGVQEKKRNPPDPEIRSIGRIDVQFTPREFPTPCRESKLPEEEEVKFLIFLSSYFEFFLRKSHIFPG